MIGLSLAARGGLLAFILSQFGEVPLASGEGIQRQYKIQVFKMSALGKHLSYPKQGVTVN